METEWSEGDPIEDLRKFRDEALRKFCERVVVPEPVRLPVPPWVESRRFRIDPLAPDFVEFMRGWSGLH